MKEWIIADFDSTIVEDDTSGHVAMCEDEATALEIVGLHARAARTAQLLADALLLAEFVARNGHGATLANEYDPRCPLCLAIERVREAGR